MSHWGQPSKFYNAETVHIERGAYRHWQQLAHWHYRSHRAPPWTQIWIATIHHEDAITRWHAHPTRRHLAGVLVVSHPQPLSRARKVATGNRYGNLRPKEIAPLIERDFRVISRVVIHPNYRGLSLSTRLIRHAMAHAETAYLEAFATMGRVLPLFERAGMTRYDVPVPDHDRRLVAALKAVRLSVADLATPAGKLLCRPSEHAPAGLALEAELQRWWRAEHPGHPDLPIPTDPTEIMTDARSSVAARPIYYIWKKPNDPFRS